MGIVFIAIASIISIFYILPSTPHGYILLGSTILGIISIHLIFHTYFNQNDMSEKPSLLGSLVWVALCMFAYVLYLDPITIRGIDLPNRLALLITYFQEYVWMYITMFAGILLIWVATHNILYRRFIPAFTVPLLIAGGVSLFLAGIWISQHNIEHYSLIRYILMLQFLLAANHLLSFSKRIQKKTRRIFDYTLLIFMGIVVSSFMSKSFDPRPWLTALFVLVTSYITVAFLRHEPKEPSKARTTLSVACLSLLSIFLVSLITKTFDENTLHRFSITIGTIVPRFNLSYFIIITLITFFACASSWSSLFNLDDYRRNMDKDLYDIKTGWAVYKWGLLIPKKRVLTYCKLILSATVIGLLVLNIYNSLFWGFMILLIFLSLSDLLFQIELFFALSWKSEFRGIHLLADTLVDDEESIIEWSTFLNKHGLKETSLFAYLDKFKDGKSTDYIHPDIVDKFKQALRYNINESYFLILMQRINSLFILEHSPLTPSKLLEDKSRNLLNNHSQFIVSRLKLFRVCV